MNIQQLQNQQKSKEKEINNLKEKIRSLPKGKLLCARSNGYVKYYKSNGSRPLYIKKKDRGLAEALAVKEYYQMQEKELSQELVYIKKMLHQKRKRASSSSLLEENSLFQPLISSYYQSYPDELTKWISQDYPQNQGYPENLIHKTFSGQKVRSKSEVIIANALFSNHIPFRYECQLVLNDIVLFPDFMIMHPKTFDIFYWEHFGMMDQDFYVNNACNKIKLYCQNGIYPTINLLTTYETVQYPIDSEKVQSIIEEYFLS